MQNSARIGTAEAECGRAGWIYRIYSGAEQTACGAYEAYQRCDRDGDDR